MQTQQPQPFKPGDMAVWTVVESGGGPFLPGKTTTSRTVTILEINDGACVVG